MTSSLLRRLAFAGILCFGFAATARAETYTMPDDKPVVSITIKSIRMCSGFGW